MTRTVYFVIGIFLAIGLAAADTLTGEIRGGVLDTETKFTVSEVAVKLVSADRAWEKPASTDADGNYVFIQLEPGRYSLSFDKAGYYPATKTDIFVRLNQPKVVIPPVELRRLVSTPTQQITVATPEGAKIAVVDLTAPIPTQAVITYVNERGYTAMASLRDSAIRWNFDASIVQGLPLPGGRSFDHLALLSPGVLRVPFTAGDGPAVGIGVGTAGQFAVNGLRGRNNNFTVDGSDNNDEDIGVRRQGFVSLVPQSVESVQEFQVITSGFPAEFGRNSGAMVNAVSRSGESRHHSAYYGIFGDDALNARGYFDPGQDLSSRQIGAVFGGPILSRRLYYFGSLERQRRSGTTTQHFVVPAPGERGLRVSRNAGGFVPINQLAEFFDDRGISYGDLAGKGVLGLYPLPNNPVGPFGGNTFTESAAFNGIGTNFSGKTDWYASERHNFSSRYNFTNDSSILPFSSDAMHSSLATRTRTQNLSLFLNSKFSTLGSAFRVSYGRTRLAFPQEGSSPFLFGSGPVSQLPAAFRQTIQTPYGTFGPFGSTGPIGQLTIFPYSAIGVDVFNFPQGRVDNTFQIAETITWTRFRHTWRAGVDARRTDLNSFVDRNSRPLLMFGYGLVSSGCQNDPFCPFATSDGLLRGTDLAALGAPAGFLQALSTQAVPDTSIGLRMSQADFFVQDDWRMKPGLIVNLGLRYELQGVTRERKRRIEDTFGLTSSQFGKLQPVGAFAATINRGNSAFDAALNALRGFLDGRDRIYDPDRNNVSPRVGFAWDMTGNGMMSLRGGYSIAYDANLGAVTSQSRNVFPTFVPVNLDLNFRPPTGQFVNSPAFFRFEPTGTTMLRPGSLNAFNPSGNALATALGSLLVQAPAVPGGDLSSNGLAFTLPRKRLDTSYAENWSLSLDRMVSSHILVSATYLGTRGVHLPRFVTPNAGLITTPVLLSSAVTPFTILNLPPSTASTSGRPQSGLGAYTVFENSAASGYHSLQLSLEQRLTRGLQFRGSWTWGHVIDDVSDVFGGRGFSALPQNSTRLAAEKASASFDSRHRVTSYMMLDLPRKFRVSATTEMQTGQPYSVITAQDRNLDGNTTDRLNRTDGLQIVSNDPWPIRLNAGVSAASLVAPLRQDGVVGRNTFRADGIAIVNAALSRKVDFGSNTSVDFRIEAFNLFNHTSFGVPVRTLESPGFGRTYDVTMEPRSVRFQVKFSR